MSKMSKIALPALAAAAVGVGVSAAPAGADTGGYWDGGTACKAAGKQIPDCVKVHSEQYHEYDDGADYKTLTCPADRPFPWARQGESKGWDSKYWVLRKKWGPGTITDFDAEVVDVSTGDGLFGIPGTVTIRTEPDNMTVNIELAIGCSSVSGL